METKFQTPFIPKKPLTPVIGQPAQRVSAFPNLLFLISIIFVVLVALAYGGLFFYEKYLLSKISTLEASLETASASIDRPLIDRLVQTDQEIRSAEMLLGSHLVPSLFFKLLESVTVSGVGFRDLSFSSASGDSIEVRLSGDSASYSALALQSDVLLKDDHFREVVFSDLVLNEKSGLVSFILKMKIDPGVIRNKSAEGGSSRVPAESPTVSSAGF